MFHRHYTPSDTHAITKYPTKLKDCWIWSTPQNISNKNDDNTKSNKDNKNDDNNKNTSLQQVQHWQAKHQTIRAWRPQKLKLGHTRRRRVVRMLCKWMFAMECSANATWMLCMLANAMLCKCNMNALQLQLHCACYGMLCKCNMNALQCLLCKCNMNALQLWVHWGSNMSIFRLEATDSGIDLFRVILEELQEAQSQIKQSLLTIWKTLPNQFGYAQYKYALEIYLENSLCKQNPIRQTRLLCEQCFKMRLT